MSDTKTRDGLTIPDQLLSKMIARAREASENAYCPYSGFPVGACVLAADGELFSGCNVENASYGLTICAERNAIFRAVTEGARRIEGLVVYTPTDQPVAPCGACRQALYEFGSGAAVLCLCDTSERLSSSLAELLPKAFGPEQLQAPCDD